MELDPPAIEIVIVPENDPWNVLVIDLGIDLGNALQNMSMRSRDCTSIP